MLEYFIIALIAFVVYWAIGVIVLRFYDPWDISDWIAMMADPRHRDLKGVCLFLFIGWFTWPIQLIWPGR